MNDKQWDPKLASPANRWVLRHVWTAPGGWYRLVACMCFVLTAIFAAATWWLHADPDSLQSDRDFFPFITVFFGVVGLLFLLFWFVAWIRSKKQPA